MQQQFAMLLPCGSPLGPDVAVSAAAAREGFWACLTTLVLQTDCPGPITLTGTSTGGLHIRHPYQGLDYGIDL